MVVWIAVARSADSAEDRLKKMGIVMTRTRAFVNSNLAQFRRAINTIVSEGSSVQYLLLDGFLHSADCASLWIFGDLENGVSIAVDKQEDDQPCIFIHRSVVAIYLFDRIGRGKLLELNERLGQNPDLLPKQLDIVDRPFVNAIQERCLLTSKVIRLGTRPMVIPRDPEPISDDHEGLSQMLSSLQPALEARSRGARTSANAAL